MRTLPSTQAAAIDIARWDLDTEFAVYPVGARAKEACFAPQVSEHDCVVPGRRYLFKRSKASYPQQYWAEVVAYRIGCVMGLKVPPTFAAFNSETGDCGALIEWFYTDGRERFVHAGDFIQQFVPNFDRDVGTKHNLADIQRMMRALILVGQLADGADWRRWWLEAMAFDALIGNTDRHQDNWGFIFEVDDGRPVRARLAPLFDNGTSMGHELELQRVRAWTDVRFQAYIGRGRHHVRWEIGADRSQHAAMLVRGMELWPKAAPFAKAAIGAIQVGDLQATIDPLLKLNLPVPLTEDRAKLMLRLLNLRLDGLRAIP